jgi:hypothetical protein
MSMTKYGAPPQQTSKTASGAPGELEPSATPVETLKESLARKKAEKKDE